MPLILTDSAIPISLDAALGTAGKEEYARLLRAARMASGRYYIFPIECDFQTELRIAMLDRLRTDLAAINLRLRIFTLTETCWDIFSLLESEEPVQPQDVVVLLGLENTPRIVQEPGAEPQRPPAIATLNVGREALRTRIPAPFLVWCLPFVYTALITQGPDFFDHYSSIFEFFSAQPQPSSSQHIDNIPILRHIEDRAPASHSMIAFYREKLVTLAEPTSERAYALLNLADALLDLRRQERIKHLAEARELTEEAIQLLTRRSNKQDRQQWARGQVIFGLICYFTTTENQVESLERAIVCFKAALQIYTEQANPREWSSAQNNLGNAYSDLATGDRTENLEIAYRSMCIYLAIACYESALHVRTKQETPFDWANTQNNLGMAYSAISVDENAEHLLQAIVCYEKALQVYTEVKTPFEWAMTQHNLGNAYSDLTTGDRTENLKRAIACYEAALRVFTEQETPYEWARTQNELGIAYYELLTDNRIENSRKAIACYEAALRVYAEQEKPAYRARMLFNLALAHYDAGNDKNARQAMQQARDGFQSMGMEQDAQKAEAWLHSHSQQRG